MPRSAAARRSSPGRGLAARAAFVRGVRAAEAGVEAHALGGEERQESLVDRVGLGGRDDPPADARLVAGRHEQEAGGGQQAQGFRRSGQQAERGQVARLAGILDEGAVAVQEHGGTKRGRRLRRLAQAPGQGRGGQARLQRQELDAASPGLDQRLFGDRLAEGRGVVGPLAVHVGLQRRQHGLGRELGKDQHAVDAADGGDERGAPGLGHQGPSRTLQAAHRLVGVDAHDQGVGKAGSGLERADMAGVHQVEAAVRPGHRAARATLPLAPGQQGWQAQDPRGGFRSHGGSFRPVQGLGQKGSRSDLTTAPAASSVVTRTKRLPSSTTTSYSSRPSGAPATDSRRHEAWMTACGEAGKSGALQE